MLRMAFVIWPIAASIVFARFVGFALGSTAQPAVQEWRLVEDLRIHEIAGKPEYTFARPTEIAMGRDSSILVQEGVQIRQFNSRGQFVRSFGRSGRGPGEFAMGIGHIGFVGDTVYAVDIFTNRISLFSATGEFLHTVSYGARFLSRDGPLFSANPEVLLSDGSALGRAVYGAVAGAAAQVTRVPLLRSTRSGEVLDTVVWLGVESNLPPGAPRVPPDFADSPLRAIAPGGSRIAIVQRSAASNDRPSTFTVTAVSARGDTLYRRAYEYLPKAIPRGRRDTVLARARGVQDSLTMTAAPNSAVAAFVRSLATFYPPVSAAIAGSNGSLWLRREPSGSQWIWDIIAPNGDRVAYAKTARNSELLAVAGQTIWMVERDSLNVPTLVRYRATSARVP